ncbi:unnamed protein product [Arabidopsis lyrata]|uniref:Late embryogenesis abundant protein LEA-2 subgroup domain-containing protein n=1 Tax=Arabidopsis lyrata subsp. lyrata TaxID=81972 RepID=D7KXX9_ARALL|nr:uncharacterized protein LOC9324818 [Arabidopsis lyrata subsp. lyrata]EFH63537.1 hypothetical protein ARALYDRAFT_316004 [Arabidopsis lyrata subsp. lyrata]CAH8257678.1 unnamed protein product [Arabidopsis lyrata]|eukprot:XP_002887278.1 uncharacterized protein LOC9324818 [Arabidopsis lyrata subsp. lyrata]
MACGKKQTVHWLFSIIYLANQETPVPNIEIASMDFTVLNITQTRLSANWDLLIRVPSDLPNVFICLQGDIQASVFYKNINLVTSSGQRYNDLKSCSPQQLRVSASISEEDIGGLIGKNIIKDINEKREVKFGSQLFLTDCRKGTTGVLSYVCDETTLRFEPGSETKATKFGNNPTCTKF